MMNAWILTLRVVEGTQGDEGGGEQKAQEVEAK